MCPHGGEKIVVGHCVNEIPCEEFKKSLTCPKNHSLPTNEDSAAIEKG